MGWVGDWSGRVDTTTYCVKSNDLTICTRYQYDQSAVACFQVY